jgi:myo-inositol-1(or 4)-monophosphatase
MTTRLDLDLLLAAAHEAALAGGRVVAQHFGALSKAREKAPGDWVSEADVASETAVRQMLLAETGISVHGEEAGGARATTEWLVDPLDGTANFVHGLEAVGVSIGLVQDGVPVVRTGLPLDAGRSATGTRSR